MVENGFAETLDISLRDSSVGVCAICDAAFGSYTEYVQHTAAHNTGVQKEKKFSCETCQKTFKQQSNLIQHKRVHTNERPYPCNFCEKAFKQKSQVMQHERLHTGEKPYKCPVCERAFPQAGQLFSHKKTHGANPFVDPEHHSDRGRKCDSPDLPQLESYPLKSRHVSRGRGRPKKNSDVTTESLRRTFRATSYGDPTTSSQARIQRAPVRVPSVRDVMERSRHVTGSSSLLTKSEVSSPDLGHGHIAEGFLSATFDHLYRNKPKLMALDAERLGADDSNGIFRLNQDS